MHELTRLSCLIAIAGIGASGPTEVSAKDVVGERLRPLPEAEWSPELIRMLRGTHDRVASLEGDKATDATDAKRAGKAGGDADAGGTLAILRTLAHHPKLLGPFLGFASALAQEGALTRRDSELLALRAAWNCRSEFEWGHHVVYARAAGLSEEEIARIPDGAGAPGWSAADRDLLATADALHAKQQIDDALWKRLEARYDEAQLVEIPFVVGQYTMLSMVANMTGVVLEEGYPRLPKR